MRVIVTPSDEHWIDGRLTYSDHGISTVGELLEVTPESVSVDGVVILTKSEGGNLLGSGVEHPWEDARRGLWTGWSCTIDMGGRDG